MKFLLFFIAVISFSGRSIAQSANRETKIYIIRHGEKETGRDPLLTAAGISRAGDLLKALKNESVQKIYVSRYRRTQMTGDSMRIQLGIDTVHYTADTLCDDLVNTIMQHGDFGKTILIIAHSNTIPKIIRKLGVLDYPQADIPDNEFDNLFMITYKNEKARVNLKKFGARSTASVPMQ